MQALAGGGLMTQRVLNRSLCPNNEVAHSTHATPRRLSPETVIGSSKSPRTTLHFQMLREYL